MKKIGQKWAGLRLRDLLFKFWDPPDIAETAEGYTNFKFCVQIELEGY